MKTTHGHIDALLNNHEKHQRNIEASIKNLETQIGQISTQLAHIEEAKKKGVQDGCE
jgi:septal ring factor EnvC (AmiA/AmiB activator)